MQPHVALSLRERDREDGVGMAAIGVDRDSAEVLAAGESAPPVDRYCSSWLSPAASEKAEGRTRISPPVALVVTSNDSVCPLTLVAVLWSSPSPASRAR